MCAPPAKKITLRRAMADSSAPGVQSASIRVLSPVRQRLLDQQVLVVDIVGQELAKQFLRETDDIAVDRVVPHGR